MVSSKNLTAGYAVIYGASFRFNGRSLKHVPGRGIDENRACMSAVNQRGAWWNSGAPHMNEAFPKRFFDNLGLVSLLDQLHQLQCVSRTAVVRNRIAGGVGGRRE